MSRWVICDIYQDARHRWKPVIYDAVAAQLGPMAVASNVVGGVPDPDWCLCSVNVTDYDAIAAVTGAAVLPDLATTDLLDATSRAAIDAVLDARGVSGIIDTATTMAEAINLIALDGLTYPYFDAENFQV